MRILGCDYGTRRIGLAVSDPDGIMAVVLRTVTVASDDDAIAAVRAAIEETDATVIVVGMPTNMNGTEGPMARKAKEFAARLQAQVSARVETSDERLSTWSAERTLLDADVSRAKRKQARDKLAAQIILQGYLDGLQAAAARAALQAASGDGDDVEGEAEHG